MTSLAGVVATVLATIPLAACAEAPPPVHVLRGTTMGTTYTIKYVGERDPSEVGPLVQAKLDAVNKLFSTYDKASEICRVNDRRSTEPFEVDPLFWEITETALDVARRTGGAFDPTVLPLVDLYGFGPRGEQPAPSDAEIESALARVGYAKLQALDGHRVRKAQPDLALDYSGIAKGYGVDAVAALLQAQGLASFMVEIGGEVRCAGEKAPGDSWVIGIEGPGGAPKTHVVEKVDLRDESVATSGSYRNFLRDGEVHHIFDPRTGRNPKNGVVSVSVRAANCTVADALATAFMVLGPEKTEKVLADLQGVGALFLMRADESGVAVRRVRWP